MSLKGKNRAIYSYNNEQRVGSNFMYKDFEKSHSYNSNFQNAKFDCASLRAAHMKFCNFDGASFKETEFVKKMMEASGCTEERANEIVDMWIIALNCEQEIEPVVIKVDKKALDDNDWTVWD